MSLNIDEKIPRYPSWGRAYRSEYMKDWYRRHRAEKIAYQRHYRRLKRHHRRKVP
jgi:hypothetical protein